MSNLKAGFGIVDITPYLGTEIIGYLSPRYAEDIYDPLNARSMVLESEGKRVAIVGCDLIALPSSHVQAAREMISKRSGIPVDHILIACTHTHFGPSTTGLFGCNPEEDYLEWLIPRLADSVQLAVNRLQDARIGWGIGKEHRVSFNRRFKMKDGTVCMNPGKTNPNVIEPAGPIDPDVGVIYVESTDGKPMGMIMNFALHYVGISNGSAISADHFGYFAKAMKELKGEQFSTIFLNGACGDINNVNVNDLNQPSGLPQIKKVCNTLAGVALGVIENLKTVDECRLQAVNSEFKFKRKSITPEDVALAERILNEGPEGIEDFYSWQRGMAIPVSWRQTLARECLLLKDIPEGLCTEIQGVQIGDSAIIGLPGEIFTQIGLDIKANSPFPVTLISELSNDYIGYVPTDEALEQGGYETWAARSALPGPGTAKAMVDLSVELLNKLIGS